jgi:D-xylonolactonase
MCQVGEGPLWHAEEERVYWTDILAGCLHWYDLRLGTRGQSDIGRPVGGFTLQTDGSLLLFLDKGTVVNWRDGSIIGTLITEVPEQRGRRFNDVIADPHGRVFCGILGDHTKCDDVLYRLDLDGSLAVVEDGVGTSNGMGFSPDLKRFYFTDTTIDTIWIYDYDRRTSSISNRRKFVNLSKEQIKPDGMTVDENGDVWSAMALGGCVIRYSPEGKERERIEFPCKLITSVTFGGKKLDRLFVTSGMGHQRGLEWGDLAGSLFKVDPGVRGIPEFQSRAIVEVLHPSFGQEKGDGKAP